MLTRLVGYETLILAGINIILGLVIFLRGKTKANNIVYALSVFSISIWMIFIYWYNNPGSADPKLLLKIVYIASYGLLFSQMIFGYYFPRKTEKNLSRSIILIVLLVLVGLYVLLIEDSVVLSVVHYPEKYISIAKMGKGYIIQMIPNFVGGMIIAISFSRKSKNLIGYEKAQSKFYLIGVLLMLATIMILDYVIPLLNGDTQYYVYSPLAVIPFTISVTYSIVENRFIRISSVVQKLLKVLSDFVYIFSAFILYQPFLESDVAKLFDFYTNTIFYIILLVAVYFVIFRNLINLLLDLIDGSKVEKKSAEESFSQVSNNELSIERLVANLRRVAKSIFSINEIGVLVYEKTTFDIEYEYHPTFKDLTSKELISVVKYWDSIGSSDILISDEIKRDTILEDSKVSERILKIIQFMDENQISGIVPFNSRTEFNGVVLLGYTADKYPLTTEDITALRRIISTFAISFGRAILYKEVEDFNKTLKQKVNEQTQELQQKVLELEEARRKERDMIDIMGHELRTPATIVKLNAELLEKYIESNPENFKKYLDRIQNSIENEIRLIDTLLSSAKLEGQKIEMNKERVSVPEQIEVVLHGYEYQAEAKGLKLISDIDEDTKDVYADKVRVGEIIDNLVSNAIKYTDEGSIIVKTESTDDHVKVSVIDTGKGIPEEEIQKLGTKFHRIEHYISGEDGFNIVRPGGTGLGLYVVYALIEMMGGKIWVDTEVGKGTTFFFTLPVYKGQREDIVATDSKNMFDKFGLKK